MALTVRLLEVLILIRLEIEIGKSKFALQKLARVFKKEWNGQYLKQSIYRVGNFRK
jgi:hypothetical protein